MKKDIPNFITSLNLLCGCMAIVFAAEGEMAIAGLLIFASVVFDFLDGFAARLLKAQSTMGVQMDSFADLISFGVAPAMILFGIMSQSPQCVSGECVIETYRPYGAFLLPVFSALRLAKFNTDDDQSSYFKGLTTTANGMFIAALAIVWGYQPDSLMAGWMSESRVLLAIVILHSYLLVSDYPMFAIKFKSFDWKSNILQYSFLLSALVGLILFSYTAIPFLIYLYILLSLLFFRAPSQNK